MARVSLFHWNAAEAEERAHRLRRAGHDVDFHADNVDATVTRRVSASPPDIFVIDLNRLPSHGRELGVWLRRQKATRDVPLVFIEGDTEKTARVRELLPDAEFTTWRRVRGTITRAVKAARRDGVRPVVPDQFGAYAGTLLPKKLGIRAGTALALLGAPAAFDSTFGTLPDGVRIRRRAGGGKSDVAVLFVTTRAELERRFEAAVGTLAEKGRLWIAWPKRASGVESDLSQVIVRKHGMDRGLVDFKICAIDETWSALCFVRRSPSSPGRGSRRCGTAVPAKKNRA